MESVMTKEELLDIAQWLEDAAHAMEDNFEEAISFIKRAEWVRHKVAGME